MTKAFAYLISEQGDHLLNMTIAKLDFKCINKDQMQSLLMDTALKHTHRNTFFFKSSTHTIKYIIYSTYTLILTA